MSEEEEIQAEIDRLILEGAMTPDHLDEDGDMIYLFDMVKLKEVNPALYEDQMREIEESVEHLVDLGILEGAGVAPDGEIVYNVTDEGRRLFDEYMNEPE